MSVKIDPDARKRERTNRNVIQPGWSLRRTGGISILTADALSQFGWLVHGFSTRAGGESMLNGQKVLNLGFTEWDSRAVVKSNRRRLQLALDSKSMHLVTLHQHHSDGIAVVAAGREKPANADAVVSVEAGLLLAAQTADCVPLLLADMKRRAVAAVHAGWRGTLARIAQKAVGRMRFEYGTQPADIVAAMGPAIGRCCYEVGPEVAQAFAGQFAQASQWFDGPFDRLLTGEEPNPLPWLTMMPPGHERPPERVRLDLRASNVWQLADVGVEVANIAVSTLCTSCRTDLFFSYRREGPYTGRLLAAIGVVKDKGQ
jgi:YfiH family protein